MNTAKSGFGWTLTYNLGRLQRVKTPRGDTLEKENGEFIYKRNGNRILAEKNGKYLWEKVFDAQGKLIEFSGTKRKMKFAYSERRTLQVSVKNTNDEDKVSTFLVKGDALDNFIARFSNTNF